MKHSLVVQSLLLALTSALAGCGGAAAGATDSQLEYAKNTAATGALLYERHCQECHGDHGQGRSDGPPLLGKQRLGKHFKNAQQLFDYVAEKMPKDNPGSLDIAQNWNIVTFLVAASGKKLDDRLSESNAEDTRLDK